MGSEKVFTFSDGLHRFGPFSKEEIEALMFDNKLMITDMIYDSRHRQWFKILQHPDFIDTSPPEEPISEDNIMGLMPDRNTVDAEQLKKEGKRELEINQQIEAFREEDRAKDRKVFNISQEGMSVETDTSENDDILEFKDLDAEKWFIKEGAIVLGPYHFLTIFAMIRDGDLDENSSIRKGKKGNWQIATTAFSSNEVQSFSSVTSNSPTSLLPPRQWKRKNLRKDFDLLFYVNDGKQEYIVQGFDISEEGLGFVTVVPCFQQGQKLKCTIVVSLNNITHVQGEVLRSEVLVSPDIDIQLTKYALKLDQRIDLSKFLKKEDED